MSEKKKYRFKVISNSVTIIQVMLVLYFILLIVDVYYMFLLLSLLAV